MSKVHSECKTTSLLVLNPILSWSKILTFRWLIKHFQAKFSNHSQIISSKESLFSIFTHHKAFIPTEAKVRTEYKKKPTIHSATKKNVNKNPPSSSSSPPSPTWGSFGWMDWVLLCCSSAIRTKKSKLDLDGFSIGKSWCGGQWSSSRVRSLILLLCSRG